MAFRASLSSADKAFDLLHPAYIIVIRYNQVNYNEKTQFLKNRPQSERLSDPLVTMTRGDMTRRHNHLFLLLSFNKNIKESRHCVLLMQQYHTAHTDVKVCLRFSQRRQRKS